MSIRKRGKGWQVRVKPFPDQTFPTKAAAVYAEADLKRRKALGDLHVEKPETFGTVLDAHEERKLSRGGKKGKVRPATVRFYSQSKKGWKPLYGVLIPNLRRPLVEDHITARAAKAPVAARNELQFAKAALRSAQSRGQRVDPGIFAIEAIRHEAAEGRALELDELDAIAAWMPERIKRIVPLCGTLGLRWSEAVNLTDAMVDLAASTLTVPRDLNKSRKEKPVDLAAFEVRLLREQLLVRPVGTALVFPNARGGFYSESGFRKVWGRATKRAGLEGVRFHWLRHTAISFMARSGMSPEKIAARVGHSDGGVLIYRRYRHLYRGEMRAAVKALDAFMDASRESASGPEVVEAQ